MSISKFNCSDAIMGLIRLEKDLFWLLIYSFKKNFFSFDICSLGQKAPDAGY